MNSLRKLRNSDLWETIIVTAGTMVGAFLSYLLQFVLGRKLSVADYGSFNGLLSLASIVGVPAAVLGISLTKVVSELFAKEDKNRIKRLYIKLAIFALVLGFLLFLVFFILRFNIASSLKINSTISIVFFAMLSGLGFITVLQPAFLQGLQKFGGYALYQIIMCFIRFLIPTVLVFLGLGLGGVFGGLAAASALSFGVTLFLLGLNYKVTEKSSLSESYKKIVLFSIPALIVTFCLTFLNNIDIIMVKKFFSMTEAGYYAGAVTLGKMFLFGAGSVTVIMFPKVAALYAKGQEYLKEFGRLVLILLMIVLAGIACYCIFPGLLTHVFFGKAFENSIRYLPLFSLFVALYVFISFLVMFFLAINKKNVSILLLPSVVLQYILLNLYHGSIFEVIWVNIIVCIITLSLLIIFLYAQVIRCQKSLRIKS